MRKISLIFILLFITSLLFAEEVKKADLAGKWYPASKEELTSLLSHYLEEATPERIDGQIFAIISPHAGFQFSGPVAAYGFKAAQRENVMTVIVIGFSHRKHFDGISVYNRGIFETPLGRVEVDAELAKNIISHDRRISFYPAVFEDENSVELEVPFIQLVFKNAKIVPIAFGTQIYDDARILADALAKSLKDRNDYLIVASTDLSHEHPYEEAISIDKRFIALLSEMKAKEIYDEGRLRICELCGVLPVTATLLAAKKLGYDNIKILKYANSGDTFGSKENVVGYLSAAIYKGRNDEMLLNDNQKKRLLQIARESVTSFVKDGKRKSFTEEDPVLKKEMGAFVTLHEKGELRGCIGNMVGQRPLYQTVADMAIEAATGDPRFPPLSPQEIGKIDIEISVLSPMKKVSSHEEVKIPGHGVLVKKGFHSGVYLPQVAIETGWNKDEFLTSLCGHKAGLPPDAWKDPATDIYVFTAEIFGEKPALAAGREESR